MTLAFIHDRFAIAPDIENAVDAQKAEMLGGIDLLDAALDGIVVERWDPANGSGSWLIEAANGIEISINDLGGRLYLSAVQLMDEGTRGGTLVNVIDRRIGSDVFDPVDADGALAVIRELAAEWRAIVSSLVAIPQVGTLSSQLELLPAAMTASADIAIRRGLAAVAAREADCEDEYLVSLVSPTSRSAADMTFASSVDDEIVLPPELLAAICRDLPDAVFVKRSGRIPVEIKISPFQWREDYRPLPNAVDAMRLLAGLGVDAHAA